MTDTRVYDYQIAVVVGTEIAEQDNMSKARSFFFWLRIPLPQTFKIEKRQNDNLLFFSFSL